MKIKTINSRFLGFVVASLVIGGALAQRVYADDLHRSLRLEIPTKSQQAGPSRIEVTDNTTPKTGGRAALSANAKGLVANKPLPFPAYFEATMFDGYTAALKDNKPMVVVIGASWCSWCQKQVDAIARSPEFSALSKCAVFIQANPETDAAAKSLAESLRMEHYPTISILYPNREFIQEAFRLEGFRDVPLLSEWLISGLMESANDPKAAADFSTKLAKCPALLDAAAKFDELDSSDEDEELDE